METQSRGGLNNDGLQAALRRFPDKPLRIRQLMLGSESFRGLCEDLALAEGALEKIDTFEADVREERRREFEELIVSLADELKQFLT
ncbi:hypothetical protein LPJGGPFB_00536 [Ensifer adhaerens]|nr:hypothetical protein [Ensifer adhaerens]